MPVTLTPAQIALLVEDARKMVTAYTGAGMRAPMWAYVVIQLADSCHCSCGQAENSFCGCRCHANDSAVPDSVVEPCGAVGAAYPANTCGCGHPNDCFCGKLHRDCNNGPQRANEAARACTNTRCANCNP